MLGVQPDGSAEAMIISQPVEGLLFLAVVSDYQQESATL